MSKTNMQGETGTPFYGKDFFKCHGYQVLIFRDRRVDNGYYVVDVRLPEEPPTEFIPTAGLLFHSGAGVTIRPLLVENGKAFPRKIELPERFYVEDQRNVNAILGYAAMCTQGETWINFFADVQEYAPELFEEYMADGTTITSEQLVGTITARKFANHSLSKAV